MKTSKSIVLICFMFLTQGIAAEQIVRVTIGEWQPYLSEHAPHYGFATHIITESFALQNIEVEYGFFPWKRSYQLARQGNSWEGTGVWLYSEDRAAYFHYSDPVVPTTVSFFHLKNTEFDWSTVADLKDRKIGVTIGYSYGPDFDSAMKNGELQTEQSRTDITNLRKILKGRIDLFPGEEMVIYSLIRDSFPSEIAQQFTHHSLPLHQNSQHLLISKANPGNERLVELFNAGLKKLKESGRYDQIIADGLAGKYALQ